MTTINCFLTPDAAHVFTDGAFTDMASMSVAGFGNKVAYLPKQNALIASTGFAHVPSLLAGAMMNFDSDSFDELIEQFETTVSCVVAAARPNLQKIEQSPSQYLSHFEAIVVGWSKKGNAPAAYQTQSTDCADKPVTTPRPITRYVRPSFDGDTRANLVSFDPANPAASGLKLMEDQRAGRFVSTWHGGHQTYVSAAGFCQHTILNKDGISMRVIKHWPDHMGERVHVDLSTPVSGSFGF